MRLLALVSLSILFAVAPSPAQAKCDRFLTQNQTFLDARKEAAEFFKNQGGNLSCFDTPEGLLAYVEAASQAQGYDVFRLEKQIVSEDEFLKLIDKHQLLHQPQGVSFYRLYLFIEDLFELTNASHFPATLLPVGPGRVERELKFYELMDPKTFSKVFSELPTANGTKQFSLFQKIMLFRKRYVPMDEALRTVFWGVIPWMSASRIFYIPEIRFTRLADNRITRHAELVWRNLRRYFHIFIIVSSIKPAYETLFARDKDTDVESVASGQRGSFNCDSTRQALYQSEATKLEEILKRKLDPHQASDSTWMAEAEKYYQGLTCEKLKVHQEIK